MVDGRCDGYQRTMLLEVPLGGVAVWIPMIAMNLMSSREYLCVISSAYMCTNAYIQFIHIRILDSQQIFPLKFLSR